ncbi:SPFH domain-containing protein [Enemella sp. A6]|uniref:SPFH domain-containing protein n=1 Tax=Enemella sp. A6 TaxID=3440152 RepID=UPI003EC02AD0
MEETMFHVIVDETERVVAQRPGRPARVLEPGRYRKYRHTSYRPVEMRSQLLPMPAQEITTADGAQVRLTLTLSLRVTDPVAFLQRSAVPEDVVYLATQVRLRERIATLEVARIAERSWGDLPEDLTTAARAAGAEVGLQVESVVIKDVVLPAELRRASTELLTVRLEGERKLAAARAETAALRAMLNGARLLDEHPALAKIRLVESAAAYGSAVHLRFDDDRNE